MVYSWCRWYIVNGDELYQDEEWRSLIAFSPIKFLNLIEKNSRVMEQLEILAAKDNNYNSGPTSI